MVSPTLLRSFSASDVLDVPRQSPLPAFGHFGHFSDSRDSLEIDAQRDLQAANTRFSESHFLASSSKVGVSLTHIRNTKEDNFTSQIKAGSVIDIHGEKKSLACYFSELDKWELKGHPTENRALTISIIKAWVMVSGQLQVTEQENSISYDATLVLDCLGLKELPCLPDVVKSLSARGNHLSVLANLPQTLITLDVSENIINTLPDLPVSLQYLDCSKNNLRTLPLLPSNLVSIHAEHNQLGDLPALPNKLDYLNVSNNSLQALPQLPGTIKDVWIDANQITHLPSRIPTSLRYLSAMNNHLISIPESLIFLSKDSRVFLDNNLFSEQLRQRLHDWTSSVDYSGPRIYFSMAGISLDATYIHPIRSVEKAVIDWYNVVAPLTDTMPIHKLWQHINNEIYAADFSQFLDRLRGTVNFSEPAFKKAITVWLDRLAVDQGLRQHIFLVAKDALGSCEDRVTLTLNTMKKEELNYDVNSGLYDTRLNDLLSLARQMFRLDLLEKIASEKVASLPFVDEVEVYLAYQIKLREKLALPIDTVAMRFFDVSYVTQEDLDFAEKSVKEAEAAHFMNYLSTEWLPWQSVLKRLFPKEYADAQEKINLTTQTEFQHRQSAYLKAQSLVDNEFNRMQTASIILNTIAYEINGDLTAKVIAKVLC